VRTRTDRSRGARIFAIWLSARDGPEESHATKRQQPADWPGIPKPIRPTHAEIVDLIDVFSKEHLNEEYAALGGNSGAQATFFFRRFNAQLIISCV
jgi:hypothetical protein